MNPDSADGAETTGQSDSGRSAPTAPARTAGESAPNQQPQPIPLTPGTEAELEAELVGDSVEDRDDVLRELESIRSAMQRELERVELILRDRRPRG
ncbi:MAG: hypothetical protein LIQ31_15765 [Planctomycetes bacterium]|nr:hypothetical protein [Planctomycetota bacterium]